MNSKIYEFESLIWRNPESNSDYIVFPYDIRQEFGKGQVKVKATYDGVLVICNIRNRGITNRDGSIRYVMHISRKVREEIGKMWGETVKVTVQEVGDDV